MPRSDSITSASPLSGLVRWAIGLELFYWGTYSKETHDATGDYYNYSRIGRYSQPMKDEMIDVSQSDIDDHQGHMLSSTWLQCGPEEGIGGPFLRAGGRSVIADVDQNIDTLHPDAGVLWWLEAVQSNYGPWAPAR